MLKPMKKISVLSVWTEREVRACHNRMREVRIFSVFMHTRSLWAKTSIARLLKSVQTKLLQCTDLPFDPQTLEALRGTMSFPSLLKKFTILERQIITASYLPLWNVHHTVHTPGISCSGFKTDRTVMNAGVLAITDSSFSRHDLWGKKF